MSADINDTPAVVLDTNVLLSLYVFADSRFANLRELIETGQWRAVTNDACLAEFARVLAYPMFSLTPQQQSTALASYTAFAHRHYLSGSMQHPIPLPRCTDADDQKFLELARDSGAKCLVTSDRALLKLARRLSRAGMFRVITPELALNQEISALNTISAV